MAKRTATSELNHDNWDKEDKIEDAGTFARASDDALKRRVIKVAKRRNPLASQSEDGKSSAFGGFSGFGKTQASSSNSFGFLNSLASKGEEPKTNGSSDKGNETVSDEYYAKLKGLNESVTEWIKKHVSENPFVNLQPVFKDYDKYYSDLEKLKSEAPESKEKVSSSTQFSFAATTSPKFSFGATTSAPSTGFSFGTATTATLSFGASTTTSSMTSAPSFSFGSSNSGSNSGKFSFTSTVIKPPDTKEDAEDDEESPKVEITPVVEEGHIYTIRCKVFVKKDGTFADHGIGTLYLKPVPQSEKVQLIVRAESNLGRLICNFILSESIPTQRMGKKDVMLVCVPNPEAQPPPVPVLLRVKSPEDADELLKTLQKHKK